MSLSAGSLFTGFGGADLGVIQAGLVPAWGVELDPRVAEVARWNMPSPHKMTIANILDLNPSDFPAVDFLHASPPCPSFSRANQNIGETSADIALADSVSRFITHHLPRFFTLENVPPYRRSASFKRICNTLQRCGYWFVAEVRDVADFGIPQNRSRLFLRARRDGKMIPPLSVQPWAEGWYAAVIHLLPALPPSQLPRWQQRRWERRRVRGVYYLLGGGNSNTTSVTSLPRPAHLPAFTITAHSDDWRVGDEEENFWRVTPTVLAALMTFPTNYILPPTQSLAVYGLGNAVPPQMMRQIVESLVGG